MKKFIGTLIGIIMVITLGVTNVNAEYCDHPTTSYSGDAALSISGNSGVGTNGYLGQADTTSYTNSCFGSSETQSNQAFIGVGISSAASVQGCLTTSGHVTGMILGSGEFSSEISGQIMGADFASSSNVVIQANVGNDY